MSVDDRMSAALEIYNAHIEAYNRKIQSREAVSSELVRATARAMALVLASYCLPENWRGEYGSSPKIPLPPQIAGDIARNIHIICDGHIPKWILHLQKRGTAPVDPRVREWQGYAIAYVELCKAGLIKNRAPTGTVAKIFGVTVRAVQNWVKNIDAEPSDFFPEAINEADRASLIADKVRWAGEQYRIWGPGHQTAHPFGKGRKRPRAKRARN